MARLNARGKAFTVLILEVFRVNGLALEAGDRLAAPAGLSSARWQILGVVDHGPASASAVARLMGLRRQSVQKTADALARDGFVEYQDNPHHRRAWLIVITPKGRKALRQVEARQAVWANRLGAALTADGLRAAAALLQEVRQHLESAHPRADRQDDDREPPSSGRIQWPKG